MGKLYHFHNLTPQEDRDIRRLLLGTASTAERESLELRLVGTPGLSPWLDIVEDELVEDYVLGLLTARDRRDFERNYLNTPEGRRKYLFISALVAFINSRRADRHRKAAPHRRR